MNLPVTVISQQTYTTWRLVTAKLMTHWQLHAVSKKSSASVTKPLEHVTKTSAARLRPFATIAEFLMVRTDI